MRNSKIIMPLTAGVLVVGCGTVPSTYQTSEHLKKTSAKEVEGALYFLPKRQVTVTATQTPITAQSIAAAQTTLTCLIGAETAATTAQTQAQATLLKTQNDFISLRRAPEVTPSQIEEENEEVRKALAAFATRQRALTTANAVREAAASRLTYSMKPIQTVLNSPQIGAGA